MSRSKSAPSEIPSQVPSQTPGEIPSQTPSETLEHQQTLELAREYREKGYCVTLYPTAAEMPPVLADCALSLIAKCEEKTIAVAVRTKETLTETGEKNLCRISDRIEKLPNWDFELAVANSRKL